MEQRETLDNEITTREGERKRLQDDAARLQSVIAASEAEIDAEAATETAARRRGRGRDPRRVAAATTSAAASRTAGAGAARLVGTTCQACHLTIPSTEAERIRRSEGNEVAYCDNCGAILVP